MKYKDSIDYIYSFVAKGSNKNLINRGNNAHINNTAFLLEKLGYTQTFKVLHITGTKGKGSTTLSLAKMIEATGAKTGAFISPHIIDERERVSINSNWISEEDFASIVEKIKQTIETSPLDTSPTFFEFFTVIALYYFYISKVDYACIEVGIGGLLDSTNIVKPTVCIITSISLDHTDVLGDTLAKIAVQKAGIIKNNTDVVSSEQDASVIEVLKNRVEESKSRLYLLGKDFYYNITKDSVDAFSFEYLENSYKTYFNLSLRGFYQAENVSIAYRAFRIVFKNMNDDFYKNVIENACRLTIKARLTFASYNPPVIVDGAHNGLSMIKVLKVVFGWYDSLIILFAPLIDKDIGAMCDALLPYKDKITLIVSSPSNSYKANDSAKVERYLESIGIKCTHIKNIYDAISYMNEKAKETNKASLVIGSLYSASNYLLNGTSVKKQ